MQKAIRSSIRPGLFIATTTAAGLLVWLGVRLMPESAPVARGAAYAQTGNCIECHGQPGNAAPDDSRLECAGGSIAPAHPPYQGVCRDLLAYFEAVRVKRTFRNRARTPSPNPLLQGERLARAYSCFQCHGELGQGGFPNSRALKGYVPGFFGVDFATLTRGGRAESVRAWITDGIDPALFKIPLQGPVARHFIEHQAVSMPKFRSLHEAEIRILTEYVIALHRLGKMDAKGVRAYSRLTE